MYLRLSLVLLSAVFAFCDTIKTAILRHSLNLQELHLLHMMNRPGILRDRQDHRIRPGQNILYDIRQSFHRSRLLRGVMQQYDRRVSGIDILCTVLQYRVSDGQTSLLPPSPEDTFQSKYSTP